MLQGSERKPTARWAPKRRAVAALGAIASLVVVVAPADAAGLDGYSGPRPLRTVDLAGRWSFHPQGRQATTIAVPGGGWYKQGFTDVDAASYSREITVPRVRRRQVSRLELGAVNHEATLYVDGRKVGTQTTSFTPSAFDLTPYVRPGGTYTIRLDVKGRGALISRPGGRPGAGEGYAGPFYTVPDAADWCEAIAQGIYRSARLAIYPQVRIADAFVRTSVADRTLAYDVTLANAGAHRRTVVLAARLSSVNARRWRYGPMPRRRVSVAARSTRTVTVGPLRWRPGPRSYWWPNVPYRPGYRAQLHDLKLSLSSHRRRVAGARYRFGFRELRQAGDHYELNGVRANLRGDSLQGAMYDRIDHGGKGDAYDTFPGFLPRSPGNGGWPEALDNYQRLGYSTLRIHQEPASPYMLDVADRMGEMLIEESAIRGSEGHQDFKAGRDNMVGHVHDLVLRDRNHPAIVRWSQSNEPDADSTDSVDFERELYGTIMQLDPTRPVSVDVTSKPYDELRYPNFATFQHYVNDDGSIATGYTDDVHPRSDRPYGRGEFIWPQDSTRQGFAWFATATEKMREKGASDIRPYALAGAWASVIPGVRSHDFLTDSYAFYPLYGEDNLPDPWSNPQIQRVQKAFDPLLVVDRDYWTANERSDPAGNWPTPAAPVLIPAGGRVTRNLLVFNDTFAGDEVEVTWEARAGSFGGQRLGGGTLSVHVPRGAHANVPISFKTPPTPGAQVRLALSAAKPGRQPRFHDDAELLTVGPPTAGG